MSDVLQVNLAEEALGYETGAADGAPEEGRVSAAGIVGVAAGLMGIGAVMTVSAAAANADRPILGWAFWEYPAVRQLVFVFGGLLGMIVAARLPYRMWGVARGWLGRLFLLAAMGLSALVLLSGVGVEVNEARRWLQVGPEAYGLRFQPSELVKVALPIFLAGWMAAAQDIRSFWLGFLPAVIAIGASIGVVGLEDFGTAALLAAVGGGMLLVGGARWWHLAMMVLPAVPAFGWLLISRAHRMERIMTFMDVWRDPEGGGYQAIQSLCTIANGGWWGRGLGHGHVKGYLPAARTDFIFAVICEELGMVGAAAVIGLLIVLMWQCRCAVLRCADPLGRLLALGIGLTLGLQAAMNIAVVTVSVPTKGISLPLVSAGGSGAIFLGTFVGILASIASRISPSPRLPLAQSALHADEAEGGTRRGGEGELG